MAVVIDAHVHAFDRGFFPPGFTRATAVRWRHAVWPPRPADALSPDAVEAGFVDPDGHLLVEDLDAAGIDAAVLMMLDHGVGFGEEAPVARETILAYYAGLTARYPGRLSFFVGVDPRRPDAAAFVRRAAALGARGLKLYPPDGYSCDDPAAVALCRLCADLGLAVMFHTAFVGWPFEGHKAHPAALTAVQKAVPDLVLFVGHAGYPFWGPEAAAVVAAHPTSYLEISQWQELADRDPAALVRTLAEFRDRVGAHRIVFGSDHCSGPRFSGTRSRLNAWVRFVATLPEKAARYGRRFTAEEVALILGGNMARILGLTAAAQA
jgi:predicted TIM-barrel fold metal-dependent hydrolase